MRLLTGLKLQFKRWIGIRHSTNLRFIIKRIVIKLFGSRDARSRVYILWSNLNKEEKFKVVAWSYCKNRLYIFGYTVSSYHTQYYIEERYYSNFGHRVCTEHLKEIN